MTITHDPHCRHESTQGGYPCDGPCWEHEAPALATLVRIPVHRDPVVTAQGHIRAAIRHLATLNISLNAYACDDSFGQPNRATDAMDELALALDSLAGAA